MSKISDAIEEMGQFSQGLVKCAAKGNEEELLSALTLSAAFVNLTAQLLKEIARNPVGFGMKILLGGRFDPYKELRPQAQVFIDRWGL